MISDLIQDVPIDHSLTELLSAASIRWTWEGLWLQVEREVPIRWSSCLSQGAT